MRRRTKALLGSALVAVVAFMFFVPAFPGINGLCYYAPDARQSLTFMRFGIGMTYVNGHFFWESQPVPYCV